jgi:hypothetical protein
MWWLRSCPKLRGKSRSHGRHGSFGAALCHKVGASATGHVVSPELPWAGARELGQWDTWWHSSQEAGASATGGVAAPELPMPSGITWCHGHVGACQRMSCHSSWLRAFTQGCPVCRVPTPTVAHDGRYLFASGSPRACGDPGSLHK